MVTDMAFVAYSVKDVPRARDFYRDILGLSVGESYGDHWVEFDVGHGTFGIGDGTPLGFQPGASTGAAFEVDDIEDLRERLLAAGADASELHDFPSCTTCFAKDPEGNRFALHQRKSTKPHVAA
jgi:catechol 2,3-dioxygenase-like lactoylglutathione lyase family enzyme